MLRLALATAAACAVAVTPASADSLIVGGHDTSTSKWPYAVHLDGIAYSCTGSLIAPQWVLTAAHCVAATVPAGPIFPAVHLTATIGEDEPYSGTGRSANGLVAYTHPNYSVGNAYDVALIQLATPLTGAATVQVVGPADNASWAAGKLSTIIGWGDLAEGGPAPRVIQEAQVPIIDDPTCKSHVAGYDAASMLCAGYLGTGGVDTCQGDSGGPLLVGTSAGWRQAGVTSFGNGCARPNDPGVYTELGNPSIRSFIASHAPNAIGGTTPPSGGGTSNQTAVQKARKQIQKLTGKKSRRASHRRARRHR